MEIKHILRGALLRRVRERLGESQPQFGKRIGVSKVAISNYETSRAVVQEPARDEAFRLLAESENVDFEELARWGRAFGALPLSGFDKEARDQLLKYAARLLQSQRKRREHKLSKETI